MSDDVLFNGFRYRPADPGREGDAIKARYQGVDATIVTKLGGHPAILHDGEFYTQAERLVPGSNVNWNRMPGGGR